MKINRFAKLKKMKNIAAPHNNSHVLLDRSWVLENKALILTQNHNQLSLVIFFSDQPVC